jgi:hypothetical protein
VNPLLKAIEDSLAAGGCVHGRNNAMESLETVSVRLASRVAEVSMGPA